LIFSVFSVVKGFSRLILITLLFLLSVSTPSAHASVLPGIDVLASRNFDILQGRRVGLITNHTGRAANGDSTIDLLAQAPGVKLVALFSPEHGIRGTSDVKLGSSVDSRTGLTIHSLYGKSCRPTPEMLGGIDMLVFDIQDIGTRFYTYIGTLSLAMRAARQAGIPFVVLDRPNPINGIHVSGAIPVQLPPERKSGCGAITSIHPIPTRHGMTIGELAMLFNSEFGINCQLTVVRMQGWRRELFFDQTGLPWVNPSPNMKSLTAALLYPGPGTLETTSLSVARGTQQPFEVYGAPWVDAGAVVRNLNSRKIVGLTFETAAFTPTAKGFIHNKKACQGVRLNVTDRNQIKPLLVGLHMVQAFYQIHPDKFRRYEGFKTELGDADAWRMLTVDRIAPEAVAARWQARLTRFLAIREKYLLY